MTFVGPYIVIYFYSKTKEMHNISNLFYFGTTLYMFRTVFPSIIRSLRLYIQHQVYVITYIYTYMYGMMYMSICHIYVIHIYTYDVYVIHTRTYTSYHTIHTASYLYGMMLYVYSLRLLMMDEETVRNMQSVVPK
jgi:hypothetical protein